VLIQAMDHDKLTAHDKIGAATESLDGCFNAAKSFKLALIHNGRPAGTVSGMVKVVDLDAADGSGSSPTNAGDKQKSKK
jgi:hypothetical protein